MAPYVEHLNVSDDDLLRMTIMNKTLVTESGCWEWQGTRARDGYGMMMRSRKRLYVHRLAYELWVQSIPDGMVIRHKCDNPRCVNPAHLIHGTQAENIHDIVERGRHGASKLTQAQVMEIRASNEPTNALAERFGVRCAAINKARRGTTWGHLNAQKRAVGKGYSAATGLGSHPKIYPADAEVIRGSKLSVWLLSSVYGVSRRSISNIRNGVTWKSLTQNRGVLSDAG